MNGCHLHPDTMNKSDDIIRSLFNSPDVCGMMLKYRQKTPKGSFSKKHKASDDSVTSF